MRRKKVSRFDQMREKKTVEAGIVKRRLYWFMEFACCRPVSSNSTRPDFLASPVSTTFVTLLITPEWDV